MSLTELKLKSDEYFKELNEKREKNILLKEITENRDKYDIELHTLLNMIDSAAINKRPELIARAEILLNAYRDAKIELKPFVKKYIKNSTVRIPYIETEEEYAERDRLQRYLENMGDLQDDDSIKLSKEFYKLEEYAQGKTLEIEKAPFSKLQISTLKELIEYNRVLSVLNKPITSILNKISEDGEYLIIEEKILYLKIFMINNALELEIIDAQNSQSYNAVIKKLLDIGEYDNTFLGVTYKNILRNIMPFIHSGNPLIVIKVIFLLELLLKYYLKQQNLMEGLRLSVGKIFENKTYFRTSILYRQGGFFSKFDTYIKKQIIYVKNSIVNYCNYLQNFTFELLLNKTPNPDKRTKIFLQKIDESGVTNRMLELYIKKINENVVFSKEKFGNVHEVLEKIDSIGYSINRNVEPDYYERYYEDIEQERKAEIDEMVKEDERKIKEFLAYKKRKKDLVNVLLEREERKREMIGMTPVTRENYTEMVQDAEDEAEGILINQGIQLQDEEEQLQIPEQPPLQPSIPEQPPLQPSIPEPVPKPKPKQRGRPKNR